jgi:transposase-like protein
MLHIPLGALCAVHVDRRILKMSPNRPKHCPICGLAMLSSRSDGSREADRFECLSCDLVINYSGGKRPGPSREE